MPNNSNVSEQIKTRFHQKLKSVRSLHWHQIEQILEALEKTLKENDEKGKGIEKKRNANTSTKNDTA